MNPQEEFWAGAFGADYTARNRVEWKARRSFWDLMVEKTGARSILEVGCNAGWNLLALRDVDSSIKLRGVDLNPQAISGGTRERARRARASGDQGGRVLAEAASTWSSRPVS
jgi:SAM-dependent methyltransferase